MNLEIAQVPCARCGCPKAPTGEFDTTKFCYCMMPFFGPIHPARQLFEASLSKPLHPSVLIFAAAMTAQLERNQHRGHWDGTPLIALIERLESQLRDLPEYAAKGMEDLVLTTCADLGNFAMMFSENYRKGDAIS